MDNIFAVISDIHGNFEALSSVMRSIEREGIRRIICLGDIVGYGTDPELCWHVVKQRCDIILEGNHEAILTGKCSSDDCSDLGKISAEWTQNNVSDEIKAELGKLCISHHESGMDFYHSAPDNNYRWKYLNETNDILDCFKDCSGIVFYSHTHRPRITVISDGDLLDDRLITSSEVIKTVSGTRYYINVGSVGQQRDAITNAAYVIFRTVGNDRYIEFCRIPYNSYKTYKKTLHQGCGASVAKYLIREPWRRKIYALLNNWCNRFRRKISIV